MMFGATRGANLAEFRVDGRRQFWILALLTEEWLEELLSRSEVEQFDYFIELINSGAIDTDNGRTIRGIHLERFEKEDEYVVFDGRVMEEYSQGSLLERLHHNDSTFIELSNPSRRWREIMLFRIIGLYTETELSWGADGPWALVPFDERMQAWLFGEDFKLPYECIDDFLETEHLDWLDMLQGEHESQQDWNLINADLGSVDYGNFFLRKSSIAQNEVRSVFFTTGKSTWYRKNLVWVKSPLTSQLNLESDLRLTDPRSALKHFDKGNLKYIEFKKWIKD